METNCEYNFKTDDFENATRRDDVSTIKKFTTNNNYEKLYPHQRRAVKFLYNCYLKNDGCILDHDESMGKTVDVCVFLDSVFQATDTALILCSEDLLLFWLYHIHKWTGLKTIVIKKNEDLHKLSRLKQIALVNVRLCSKLTTHAWKIIVLDNADETINMRGFRGYFQKQLSFNIALTNAKLQCPSNRKLLWTVLHNFVCLNLKLTKKDFLTNCTCTLEELLWCPWKDYYLRMGWMSHCNIKPLIDPKEFESDFYIWRKNYISGKKVEPVETDIPEDKNIIIEENFEDKLENLVAPEDENMNTEHESETKLNNCKLFNAQPEVQSSSSIETPYFIEINGELCSPKYIEIQNVLKKNFEERKNIPGNNDDNCKTVNKNCDNSKLDMENYRKSVLNSENSKNNAVETNSSKADVSVKNKKSWEETFDNMLFSTGKTEQTNRLNKEKDDFIKKENTSVSTNLISVSNTCSDVKNTKKSWEETFDNMLFGAGKTKAIGQLNKEKEDSIKNENTSVSTNLISASNTSFDRDSDKNNESACNNYNTRKTSFNGNAVISKELKVANERRDTFENFKIFKDRSTPDKKLDEKSTPKDSEEVKICKKFNFMEDFESMLKTPKKVNTVNENISAQSVLKNIDTDISIKKFDIDKHWEKIDLTPKKKELEIVNKQNFKEDKTKTVSDSNRFSDVFTAHLNKQLIDSCDKRESYDRLKHTKTNESPDNLKSINGMRLNSSQSKIHSSEKELENVNKSKETFKGDETKPVNDSKTSSFFDAFESLVKKRKIDSCESDDRLKRTKTNESINGVQLNLNQSKIHSSENSTTTKDKNSGSAQFKSIFEQLLKKR